MRIIPNPHEKLTMKKNITHRLLVFLFLNLSLALHADTPVLRVLTIGNSFADDITRFFPDLMREAGKPLLIYRANLGGASFQRHNDALKLYLADPGDPGGRPYRTANPVTGAPGPFGLPEILGMAEWDIITIQQVSHQSFRPETYEPHASELLAQIRRLAPGAEIILHQVWAYREDHRMFRNPDFTPQRMHQGIRDSSREFAARNGLRVLPVGDAFHQARQTERWTYRSDPDFNYSAPEADTLPAEQGSLFRGYSWRRRNDGQAILHLDGYHANAAGSYLGACVLFRFLHPDTDLPDWTPADLTDGEAADLRRIATATLAAYDQPVRP